MRRPGVNGVPPLPNSSGFDSLQDLLEREGYKETRIVTPIGKPPPVVSIDDMEDEDEDDAAEVPVRRDPVACAAHKHAEIHAWMQGMLAARETSQSMACKPSALHKSRSEAGLRRRIKPRRSALWDASRAYCQGPSEAQAPPPVRPVPSASVRTAPVAEPQSSTMLSLAFLSQPAAPILSRQDAVAVSEPAEMKSGLRRSKSEELLHKTLRARRQQTRSEPACLCGRNKEARGAKVEPRWHAQDCPVRVEWALTMPSPVPPPPPMLTISTPRGLSTPKHLELSGAEYDAIDPRGSSMGSLFGVPEHFGVVKRATLAGLNSLFKSSERVLSDPSPYMTRSAPRYTSPAGVRRSSSLPRIRTPRLNERTGSQRIHELRQHVEHRVRSDAFADAASYPMLAKFAEAAGTRDVRPGAEHTGARAPDEGVSACMPADPATVCMSDVAERTPSSKGTGEAAPKVAASQARVPPRDAAPHTPVMFGATRLVHLDTLSDAMDLDDMDVDLASCHALYESPTVQRSIGRRAVGNARHSTSVPVLRDAVSTRPALPPLPDVLRAPRIPAMAIGMPPLSVFPATTQHDFPPAPAPQPHVRRSQAGCAPPRALSSAPISVGSLGSPLDKTSRVLR